jgi:predicted sugar kinase
MELFTATPEQLQELSDGELLDIIYEVVENDTLDAVEVVSAIKRLLEESKGEN